jgi:hypothetical protein
LTVAVRTACKVRGMGLATAEEAVGVGGAVAVVVWGLVRRRNFMIQISLVAFRRLV